MDEIQKPAEEEKEKGIRCSRCGCPHFFTRNTRAVAGKKIRRYRVCRNCSKTITTVEVVAGMAE